MLFVVSRGQSREFLRDLIQPLSSSGDGGFFRLTSKSLCLSVDH